MAEDAAKSYGNLVHRMLETLPLMQSDMWDSVLKTLSDGYDPQIARTALDEAITLIENPDIRHIFDPSALAEVPITAAIAGKRIHGTIDRLLVTETEVLAIDYKTNRVVPHTADACPEGLLRQMGAYAAALRQVFPDHDIRTAILWTRNATLMALPDGLITNALSRALNLDDGAVAT